MSQPLSLAPQCQAKFALGLAAALSVCAFAPRAAAQLLGAPGTLAIGVENLTGYDATTVKYNNRNNAEITDTTTQFSLFLKTGARVGVHYFVVPQVSIGGSLGYESFSGSVSQPDANGNFSVDKRTDSAFLLHLKVGYLLPLSNTAGFYRAGCRHRNILDSRTRRLFRLCAGSSRWLLCWSNRRLELCRSALRGKFWPQ